MRLIIAISRALTLEPTYTTVHIAACALERGHQVRFVEPWDFEIDSNGRLITRAHAVDEALTDREALVELLNKRRAMRRYVEISPTDTLLLRINPPDHAVFAFAQLAQRVGCLVHNEPSTLMLTGHKGYLATLSGVPRPSTLVTRSRATALLFAKTLASGAVLKPARSSGGRGVGLVRNPRRVQQVEQVFDAARRQGDGYVVIQEYLPAASEGEKRLVWLDGKLIGGYLRRRPPGEFRHNLARGATPEPCVIGPQDHALVERISPHLLGDGVWLAGLDVIDGRIVEVNTLNPGGVHYGDALNNTRMAVRIVKKMEDENADRQQREADEA